MDRRRRSPLRRNPRLVLWTSVNDATRAPEVALFIPCFVDQVTPEIGRDLVSVLERLGCRLRFPEGQTCCGQPAFNAGYRSQARAMMRHFLDVFDGAEAIVCPSGSCTAMARRFYAELAAGEAKLEEQARQVCPRVYEFSEFVVRRLGVVDLGAKFPHRVAVHDGCHMLRELRLKQEPRELLRRVEGLELVEIEDAERCCGFGGSFSIAYGMVSEAMAARKADALEASGVEYVAACDPSCLLQIGGVLARRPGRVRTLHLASLLARGLE